MDPHRFVENSMVASQSSWVLRNDNVEIAVTHLGAHMAPVTFCKDQDNTIQPYHISPWQNERPEGLPAVMVPLRGDFFCLPFGGNQKSYCGENHPPHGETAGNQWTLRKAELKNGATTLGLQLETKVRPGVVDREFTLIDGHNVVYCRTTIEGFAGPTPFAHHAILRMPQQQKALRIFSSPFSVGRTYPIATANPASCEYQSLVPDAPFSSLSSVPSLLEGEPECDCSAFPIRPGFCDLLQQFERTSSSKLSWVAAINLEESWIWFALKDAYVMPGRLFWIEDRGRHYAPWNGRNSCLGVEDGCMYFAEGLYDSCQSNPINQQGIPTCVHLDGETPVDIRYIQGAVNLPAGFTDVARLSLADSTITFHSSNNQTLEVPVNHLFLHH